MKKQLTMAVVGFSLLAFLSDCSKSKNTQLKIRLTAIPAAFDAVNVDIKEVWVKTTKENTGWFFLKTNTLPLNLNRLCSGKDTLIATGAVPESEIREIRFILGDRNTVVSGGKQYKLAIDPALEGSSVTLTLKRPLVGDAQIVVFDFDASKSITNPASNEFYISPVIRLK